MNSTTNRWKLGLFVVLANVAIILVLTWLGLNRLDRPTIGTTAYFDESVHGLTIGAAVEFRGVPIGRVSDIRVAPDKKHIEVKAEVYRDKMEEIRLREPGGPNEFDPEAVPTGLRVQLVKSPLTGIAYIQADIVLEEDFPPPDYPFEVARDTLHTMPSTLAQLESGIVDTLNSLPVLVERLCTELEALNIAKVSADVSGLVTSLRNRIDNLEQLALVKEATKTLKGTREAVHKIDRLAAEWASEEGPLKTLSADYRRLASRVEEAVARIDAPATAESIRGAGKQVGNAADAAAVLTRDLRAELTRLRSALGAVERLANLLERDPGALLHGKSSPPSPTPRRN